MKTTIPSEAPLEDNLGRHHVSHREGDLELVKEMELETGVHDFDDDSQRSAGDSLTQTNSASASTSERLKEHSMNIEKTIKRTLIAALMVVVVGAAAAAVFLYVGISSEKESQKDEFEKQSKDFLKEIAASWQDYEDAAKWMHESCRNWKENNMTFEDFHVQYEYAISGGLEFYGMQLVANVTHQDRLELEEEAFELFGSNHSDNPLPGVNYVGFKDPKNMAMVPTLDQPFYYAILFIEPRNYDTFTGIHLDLHQAPWESPTIELAMNTWKPTLTPPFMLLDTDDWLVGYTVVLYHPGVKVKGKDEKSDHVNNILVRIHDLLRRASKGQTNSLAVYLYDITDSEVDAAMKPQFLGGIEVDVQGYDDKTVNFYRERSYEELLAEKGGRGSLLYEEQVAVGGRTWSMVVVPVDDSYEPDLIFVVLSGSLIFAASIFLALWMLHNMKRSIEINRLMTKAAAEAAIVSNLFPESIKQRLINDAKAKNNRIGVSRKEDIFRRDGNGGFSGEINQSKLNSYLTSEGVFGSKPIAELHPHCTLMFADLVGFTAWSSVRDPAQVFTLLELIYHSFDNIAKRRRVFKVETVGDCYVACAGCPTPMKGHAVVMARFATDCLYRLQKLAKALETTLGPDTGDLAIRIGLHSGQVTAGVLRGEKGRFQLFGDTMNTASRMESTGVRNKIQVSEETAVLLKEAGRGKWLVPREDQVKVKGKGTLSTFFLKVINGSKSSGEDSETSSAIMPDDKGRLALVNTSKRERLVDWNLEVLSHLLKRIVAVNVAKGKVSQNLKGISTARGALTVLDEVMEVIQLPGFDAKLAEKELDPSSIELDKEVMQQLRLLVSAIAAGYHDNPFHNFEHASHVTMSVTKMAKRIVEAKQFNKAKSKESSDKTKVEADLYDFTFGIAHDAMTQFVVTFAAIIHDIDHQGVPNATLVEENSGVAAKYRNRSVAEQNSVDLAWDLLHDPQFDKLRSCSCADQNDYARFRQMLVNIVLATDIMDKELGALRKGRWNKAFADEGEDETGEEAKFAVNRKATIVLEHLIQASDVSHTMQHWHIYAKWNERLFTEMYKAYKQGRIKNNPALGWYQGEIGFFDFYIIPLAQKLFKCGVFGVSSDEYLNYAMINRKEWEKKGERMVEQYLINFNNQYEEDGTPKKKEIEKARLTLMTNPEVDSRDFDTDDGESGEIRV